MNISVSLSLLLLGWHPLSLLQPSYVRTTVRPSLSSKDMPNIVDALLPDEAKAKGRLAYSAAWGLTCSAMPVSGSQANSLVAPLADASRAFAQSLSNATTGTASCVSCVGDAVGVKAPALRQRACAAAGCSP